MTTPPARAGDAGYSLRGRQGTVVEALGRAIVSGRYAPGDLLPKEDELSEEYGVSRTTIRSAVTVLAAKGMIEIRTKVGTRVRPAALWNTFDSNLLSWSHAEGQDDGLMEALIELRQVMEPAAARLAAGRATMKDLGPLSIAVDAMTNSVGDQAGYAEWDVAFHQAVYDASQNPLLARFGMLVGDFMRIAFEIQQNEVPNDQALNDDAARHRRVYDAISRGEAELAAEAMLDVVLDGKNTLAVALLARQESE
jgi:GntR family galactonate operon transcriptional repressor